MPRPTDASIFVRELAEQGGRMGNGPFHRHLGWTDKKYWTIHQELFDAGLIERGRGRGGTVILVVPETAEAAKQAVAVLPRAESAAVSEALVEVSRIATQTNEVKELNLYEPAVNQLKRHWSQRRQLLHGVYEITALQGRRETGGSWSRPDISAVGLRKFEYIPDRVFEVYTFEIKAAYDVSIKGVLEALAHREASTRAYVVYHTGGRSWDDFAEAQRIEQLAARHGVGVIAASDINKFNECWDERVTATRSGADPEVLDRFIKMTLSEDAKSQIRKWF